MTKSPTTKVRDWHRNRNMWIKVLETKTGVGLAEWNRRVRAQTFHNREQLEAWLTRQGVTGYARQLLVMERFGYPDFLLATGEQLIDRQYADHPHLRTIYDAIVRAASACGDVFVQARKTYVSLVSPRRTFARVQRTTNARVDLGLRLEGQRPGGRVQPSTVHETMRLRIGLAAPADVDAEVRRWLRRAYAENA